MAEAKDYELWIWILLSLLAHPSLMVWRIKSVV